MVTRTLQHIHSTSSTNALNAHVPYIYILTTDRRGENVSIQPLVIETTSDEFVHGFPSPRNYWR